MTFVAPNLFRNPARVSIVSVLFSRTFPYAMIPPFICERKKSSRVARPTRNTGRPDGGCCRRLSCVSLRVIPRTLPAMACSTEVRSFFGVLPPVIFLFWDLSSSIAYDRKSMLFQLKFLLTQKPLEGYNKCAIGGLRVRQKTR
jgi:hypothetical protein